MSKEKIWKFVSSVPIVEPFWKIRNYLSRQNCASCGTILKNLKISFQTKLTSCGTILFWDTILPLLELFWKIWKSHCRQNRPCCWPILFPDKIVPVVELFYSRHNCTSCGTILKNLKFSFQTKLCLLLNNFISRQNCASRKELPKDETGHLRLLPHPSHEHVNICLNILNWCLEYFLMNSSENRFIVNAYS